MAKFSACYQLCPLIDQKSFLGVTDESVNGCVIITLGKNMVIRYKLPDQKQVSSWSSRDKLSAPVVYDAETQHYIGVFNANQISTWKESCVELNNVKKLKFTNPIEYVLTSPISGTPVVVFRDGSVLPLQKSLDRRKELPTQDLLLEKDENIVDAQLISVVGTVTVALFTSLPEEVNRLHLIPVEEGLLSKTCLHLKRKTEDGTKLIGHTLVTHDSCKLLTLWSDGQLFSLELPTPNSEQFPGRLLTTLTTISPRYKAAILALSSTHIAIYGADASEDGALLFIFNTQLCVVQCKQFFKLYTSPARLWAAGRDALLLVAGEYVTVVPFYLGKQRLAALVGSQDSENASISKGDWYPRVDNDIKTDVEKKSSFLQKTMDSFLEEGMSHRMICQSLFAPTLDSRDFDGITNLLKTLSDIPETCIIAILAFCLEEIKQPKSRELLRTVLRLPVTPDLTTLKLLRHKLSLASVLTLLKELSDAMLETPADPLLVEWATLLLDAHYQQYLLSKDDAVLETLKELKAVVNKQVEDLTVWQQLEPLLMQVQNKQGIPDPSCLTNDMFSTEYIKLY